MFEKLRWIPCTLTFILYNIAKYNLQGPFCFKTLCIWKTLCVNTVKMGKSRCFYFLRTRHCIIWPLIIFFVGQGSNPWSPLSLRGILLRINWLNLQDGTNLSFLRQNFLSSCTPPSFQRRFSVYIFFNAFNCYFRVRECDAYGR